ncbi:MAG: hypothetical protein ACK415_12665 [Thermodesulfovibrionales bacterium]
MARFIGSLKTIKIEADRKVQLTYDIQVNMQTRTEFCRLIEDYQEGMFLYVSEPLSGAMVSLYVLLRTIKIDIDKAQLSIEFMMNDRAVEKTLFDLITLQSSNIIFEFSNIAKKEQKPVSVKEAA